MQQQVVQKQISLRELKRQFSTRFPSSKLSEVLIRLPDEIAGDSLPAYLDNWLAILDAEAEG